MVDRTIASITQEEISAIIGHWRNGAKYEQISWVTGIDYYTVEKIITDYELQLSNKK